MVNSRDKGASAEREVASIFREVGYQDAKRGQQFCGLEGAADVVGVPGLHIEVKRRERLNIHDALTKCHGEALCGDMPIVIHRRNGEQWIASVSLADFLRLWVCLSKPNCSQS